MSLPGTHEFSCAEGYTYVAGACEDVNECDTDDSCQPDTLVLLPMVRLNVNVDHYSLELIESLISVTIV